MKNEIKSSPGSSLLHVPYSVLTPVVCPHSLSARGHCGAFNITPLINSFKLTILSFTLSSSTMPLTPSSFRITLLLIFRSWQNSLNPPPGLLALLLFRLVSCTHKNISSFFFFFISHSPRFSVPTVPFLLVFGQQFQSAPCWPIALEVDAVNLGPD